MGGGEGSRGDDEGERGTGTTVVMLSEEWKEKGEQDVCPREVLSDKARCCIAMQRLSYGH